jgi:hypothetical protein
MTLRMARRTPPSTPVRSRNSLAALAARLSSSVGTSIDSTSRSASMCTETEMSSVSSTATARTSSWMSSAW